MSIEIVKFQPCNRNTLRGFLTVRLTSLSLEIRGIAVHENLDSGGKWLSMPSQSYTDKEGKLQWKYILDIYDKDMKRQFNREVFDALEKYQDGERA